MTEESPCAAEISSAKKEDVALIQAVTLKNADEAAKLMTTLDKLENFKRYSIAIAFVAIYGGLLGLGGIAVSVLIYKGQYDSAIEVIKWLITVVGVSVSTIVAFYFAAVAVGGAKES